PAIRRLPSLLVASEKNVGGRGGLRVVTVAEDGGHSECVGDFVGADRVDSRPTLHAAEQRGGNEHHEKERGQQRSAPIRDHRQRRPGAPPAQGSAGGGAHGREAAREREGRLGRVERSQISWQFFIHANTPEGGLGPVVHAGAFVRRTGAVVI